VAPDFRTHIRILRCDPTGVSLQSTSGGSCANGDEIKTNCFNIDRAHIEDDLGKTCSNFIGRTKFPCRPDANGDKDCKPWDEVSNYHMAFEYCGNHPTDPGRCRSAFPDGISVDGSKVEETSFWCPDEVSDQSPSPPPPSPPPPSPPPCLVSGTTGCNPNANPDECCNDDCKMHDVLMFPYCP